jgi:hypothetical protein
MQFKAQNYNLTVIQEHTYDLNSQDNIRHYHKEYQLLTDYGHTICYGITCEPGGANCVILAGGGGTTITNNSIIIIDRVWVAIGDEVVCLSLPSLDMLWHNKFDYYTCFEIFISPDNKGIIIHGEMQISKITFDGDIIWTTDGKDIFSEGFSIFPDHIEAVDFNNERYSIRLDNGITKITNS